MIELSEEDRSEVEGFIRHGKANARTLTRAHILLKDAEGWSITRLAAAFGVSEATVSNIRKRFHEGGMVGVLSDKVQEKRRRALSGAGRPC